jgi:hypothetical protein
VSPFLANYGFHPRIGFEPVQPDDRPAARDAEDFAQRMEATLDFIRAEIRVAQARQEEQANTRRRPARRFREGQYV